MSEGDELNSRLHPGPASPPGSTTRPAAPSGRPPGPDLGFDPDPPSTLGPATRVYPELAQPVDNYPADTGDFSQLPLPQAWEEQLKSWRDGSAAVAGQRPPGRWRGRSGRGVRGRWGAGRSRPDQRWKRIPRRTVIAVVVAALAFAVCFGLLLALTPSTGNAQRRAATVAAAEHATPLTGPLPTRVVEALVATEDSRFYSHSGVDPIGAVRGTFGPLFGAGDQGGATLDQQLAKMIYTGGHRSFTDRIEQVGLAVKLDANYSKADILRMYLDVAYFGHGHYGIVAASRGYFDRDPVNLTWAQASMLAGLVQAPSLYDPVDHLAAGKARQRHVLDRLVATGRLTAAQANTVYAAPLALGP